MLKTVTLFKLFTPIEEITCKQQIFERPEAAEHIAFVKDFHAFFDFDQSLLFFDIFLPKTVRFLVRCSRIILGFGRIYRHSCFYYFVSAIFYRLFTMFLVFLAVFY